MLPLAIRLPLAHCSGFWNSFSNFQCVSKFDSLHSASRHPKPESTQTPEPEFTNPDTKNTHSLIFVQSSHASVLFKFLSAVPWIHKQMLQGPEFVEVVKSTDLLARGTAVELRSASNQLLFWINHKHNNIFVSKPVPWHLRCQPPVFLSWMAGSFWHCLTLSCATEVVSPSASGAPSRRARACEGGGRWTALNGIDWTNCADELHLCHAKKNTKSRAPFPQRSRAASNPFLPLENCKLCAVEDFMLLLSWYLVKTELGKFSVIDYDACFCPNPTSRHFAHCTPAKCAIWSHLKSRDPHGILYWLFLYWTPWSGRWEVLCCGDSCFSSQGHEGWLDRWLLPCVTFHQRCCWGWFNWKSDLSKLTCATKLQNSANNSKCKWQGNTLRSFRLPTPTSDSPSEP